MTLQKLILVILIFSFQISTFAQRKFLSVDVGYQIGANQFFETGLGYSMITDKFGATVFAGLEDDINSKNLGYKLGVTGFVAKRKALPLSMGMSVINYRLHNESIYCFRPEVGITGIILHYYRGITLAHITLGYNVKPKAEMDEINTFLLKVSLQTNLGSFIDLFRGAVSLVGGKY